MSFQYGYFPYKEKTVSLPDIPIPGKTIFILRRALVRSWSYFNISKFHPCIHTGLGQNDKLTQFPIRYRSKILLVVGSCLTRASHHYLTKYWFLVNRIHFNFLTGYAGNWPATSAFPWQRISMRYICLYYIISSMSDIWSMVMMGLYCFISCVNRHIFDLTWLCYDAIMCYTNNSNTDVVGADGPETL